MSAASSAMRSWAVTPEDLLRLPETFEHCDDLLRAPLAELLETPRVEEGHRGSGARDRGDAGRHAMDGVADAVEGIRLDHRHRRVGLAVFVECDRAARDEARDGGDLVREEQNRLLVEGLEALD